MKRSFFLRSLILSILSFHCYFAYPKTVYLSSTGDDTKDGLSLANAVKYFSTAQSKTASGDTIQVSGMIDFANDPNNTASPKVGIILAKTLTIQGTSSATDGFDGNNVTRFIQANSSSYTLTLKNLKLYHGAYPNSLSGGGGALYVGGSNVVGENLVFDSNTANGNSTNTNTGSAIQVGATKGLSFKNCIFSNNTSYKAGAIYVNDANYANVIYRFEGCSFISNTAQNAAGGAAFFMRTAANSTGLKVYFVNCTVAKNSVSPNNITGGALWLYSGLADTEVNIVNSTITENTTGGSSGFGAGLCVYYNGTGTQFLGKLNIQNTIIENNTCTKNTPNEYSDLCYSAAPTTSVLAINNSFVGRCNQTVPTGCYPAPNNFQYEDATINAAKLKANFGTFNTTYNCYPLQSTSPAINYGASTYLSSLSPAVLTDQVGNTRPFTNSVCDAGAIEVPKVTITASTGSTVYPSVIPLTITFSNAVTGFDISDITVSNGTKSNFSGSGTTYTVDITPSAPGSVTVDIAAGAGTNIVNGNQASSQFTRTVSKDKIYLSSTGNDANNGLTPATAVASFSRAQTLASSGETIIVSGMIDFSVDPANTASPQIGIALAKTLTIQGISPTTDGFDGKNLTRFIQAGNVAYTLTLKNLKLYRGAYTSATGGGGGALYISGSTVIGENLIFDSNSTSGNSGNTGSAIQVGSTNGISFKNCIFSNNTSIKAGTIYINDIAANATVKFEGCAFISNTAQATTGGSAIFLRSTLASPTLTLINCTVAKNNVSAAVDGGAIYLYMGQSTAIVNIINCTITENTTAGTAGHGAGIRVFTTQVNGTVQFAGRLNIQNSIIEGNYSTQSGNPYSDLSISALAATSSTLMINNSFIGKNANVAVPAECYPGTNQFNYVTSATDLKNLAPFNSTYNYYPLYSGSVAIGYGVSSYLSGLSPAVNTDQLGNTRSFSGGVCDAGAAETTKVATTTPGAPTITGITAGNAQLSVAFTPGTSGGASITTYKYSLNGGTWTTRATGTTASPIVISGLTNGTTYSVQIKAVNANGDGTASQIMSGTPVSPSITVSADANLSTYSPTSATDVTVTAGVLTIDGNASVKSITVAPGAKLTLSSGTLTATNGITLQSSSSGTATFVDTNNNAPQAMSGTVQQYLTAERNWYTASPITAGTAAALNLGTSVQTYSESAKGWSILNSGDALVAGKGYVSVATTGTGATGTVSFNGTLNTGTITVPVTRTESGSSRGFNLVANPYPSYIDWSLVTADAANANIGSTMWFRTKNTLGTYTFATHNGTSGETVTGTANTTITKFIPPLQAFWIRVNANLNTGDVNYPNNVTSITFKNSMRAHRDDNGNKLKAPKQDERKRLRLQVSNGAIADEALVYFDAHAQDGFDNYDSPKMFNNAASIPEIYTQAGTEKLVINGMNELKYDTEIPLGFATAQANDFSISASEMTNFEAGTRVILIDKQNPTFETELTNGAVYNFSAPVTTASTNRFSLLFRVPSNTTGVSNTETGITKVFVNTQNQITIIAKPNSKYAIYNAVGQVIENGILNSELRTRNPKLAAGVYVVKVNNQSTRVVVK